MIEYKKYNAKVYSLDGTYKFTINPKDVKSDIRLSTQINGGQNELRLTFNRKSVDIINTDIVKVYEITNYYPNGILVYTGIVQNVITKITNYSYEIELPLLGLASIFTYKIYNGTRDEEPADMVKYFIDLLNQDYNLFSYGLIENYGTSLNLEFSNKNLLDCLKIIQEATGFYFYINANGSVDFKPKNPEPTHKLTLGKEIDNLELYSDTEELVNRLILEWNGGTTIYEDTTSQGIYGIREKYENKSEIQDQESADEYGNNYIEEHKTPTYSTKLRINNNYNPFRPVIIDEWGAIDELGPIGQVYLLKVGDNIDILNTELNIKNKQIVRASYYRDYVDLELEKYETFGKQFS